MRIPRWASARLLASVRLFALLGVLGIGFMMCGSVAVAGFIIGGGMLLLGGIIQITMHQFLKRAHHADGVVIAHKKEPGERVWFPIVHYTLPHGQEITFQGPRYNSPKPLPPVSTEVRVLYDPGDPQSAIIDHPVAKFWVKFGGYYVILLGIAFLVFATLTLVGLIHPSVTGGFSVGL